MYIDLHVLLTNSFNHRVLRIEPINTAVYKGVLVGVLNLICIAIKNRRRKPGKDVKILSDRMLHKGFC